MSRDRNVFKLSGNMALGGGLPGAPPANNYKYVSSSTNDYNNYSSEDMSAAKNSLQLLKNKLQAKKIEEVTNPEVPYLTFSLEQTTSPTPTATSTPTPTPRPPTGNVLSQ